MPKRWSCGSVLSGCRLSKQHLSINSPSRRLLHFTCPPRLFLPKIKSVCTDDAIRPALVWRQWLRIGGWRVAAVRPCSTPGVCASHCSRENTRSGSVANAARRRSGRDPGTRGGVFRSSVQQGFRQGDRGEIGRSRIPIARTRLVKASPYAPSLSRTK